MSFVSRVYARSTGRVSGHRERRFGWITIASFAVAALALGSAQAGVNTFTQIGPEGGQVYDVAFHPTDPSIAYAVSTRGFYRSDDGGFSWQLTHETFAFPYAIAVHPIAPLRVVLLLPGAGLLLSDDSGMSFTEVETFPEEARSAREIEYSANGAALYVAAENRVYRSINQGSSWELRGALPDDDLVIDMLAIEPGSTISLFAASGTAVYRSSDAGETWTIWSVPAGPNRSLAIVGSSPRRIWLTGGELYYSDDEGANWTTTEDVTSFGVAVDPSSSSTIYSITPRILRRTTDNGVHWADAPGTSRIGTIQSIAFQGNGSGRILISGADGIMGSDDGGNTWTIRNDGIDSVHVTELIATPGSEFIYANTSESGVYAIATETGTIAPLNNDAIRELAPSRATLLAEGFTAFPGAPDRLFVGLPDGVARSSDGGTSWALITHSEFDAARVIQLTNASEDGQTLVAVTGEGVLRSINGGDDWSRVSDVADVRAPSSLLAAAPSNPSIVYLIATPVGGSEPSAVYRSSDAGASWTRVGSPTNFIGSLALDPRDENTLYTAGGGGVFRSTDGGQNWASILGSLGPIGLSGAIAVDPQNSDVLYLGGVNRVLRSVDGAQTWDSIPMVNGEWFPRALAIDPSRPHRVYAGGLGGVHAVSIQPDLTIRAIAATEPSAYGTAATHAFTVENLGPFAATQVRTQIQLPSDASDVQASVSSGTCTIAANVATCTTSALRSGETVELSVVSSQPAAGQYEITGFVTANEPDLETDDNSVTSQLIVAEISDLAVSANAQAEIRQGNAIAYSFTITNAGPNDASEVTAEVILPAGFGFSTIASAAGTCSSAANLAACTLTEIESGATVTIEASTLPVGAIGPATTIISIAPRGVDPDQSDNMLEITTNVTPSPPPPSGGNNSGGGSGGGGSMAAWLLALLFSSGWLRSWMRRQPSRLGPIRGDCENLL